MDEIKKLISSISSDTKKIFLRIAPIIDDITKNPPDTLKKEEAIKNHLLYGFGEILTDYEELINRSMNSSSCDEFLPDLQCLNNDMMTVMERIKNKSVNVAFLHVHLNSMAIICQRIRKIENKVNPTTSSAAQLSIEALERAREQLEDKETPKVSHETAKMEKAMSDIKNLRQRVTNLIGEMFLVSDALVEIEKQISKKN